MERIGFFLKLTWHHIRVVCRRRILISFVLILCIALPLCIGPAMQAMFSGGVSFSGLTLAVTAPEGSPAPEMIERYVGGMQDVSEYCSFRAMDRTQAEQELKDGKIAAIIVLPNRFFTGVMTGENPDVDLIVRADRPMESLLTYWLGQSLTDILSAAQAGIYAVLDEYADQLPEGLTEDDVITGINLKYIGWTLGRGDMFAEETCRAVQTMPVAMHYGLSLLSYLAMSLAPLFAAVYAGGAMEHRRRLRCLGYGSLFQFGSDLAACTAVVFLISAVPICLIVGGSVPAVLLAAMGFSLFCALFGSLCCLITDKAANSGLPAFAVSLLSLGVSGGVLPPSLLPETLRRWSWLSPIHWLRELAAASGGVYAMNVRSVAGLLCGAAVMFAACAWLYHRRVTGQEVTT